MRHPDVVVIGGGPAGGAAAIRLARGGARVMLLEKTRGSHHKVCGEFVSAAARQHLHESGIAGRLLDRLPIETIRVCRGARTVEADLPFRACSLSRMELDEALLRIAAREGVDVRRGCRVRTVTSASGVQVSLDDGGSVAADAAFLATGKHVLRGLRRDEGVQNGLVGLKMHLDLTPDAAQTLTGAVELLFFGGGYAGLQLVAPHRANLCLLIGKTPFAQTGRGWTGIMQMLIRASPHWRRQLLEARAQWMRPLTIANLPYGFVAPVQSGPVFRLGDQLAVVPSFAGDGMAMALSSGRQAAESYLAAGPDAAAYHARMAGAFGPRVRASAWTSRLLERPLLQSAAMGLAGLAPGLLGWAADITRIGGRENSACG